MKFFRIIVTLYLIISSILISTSTRLSQPPPNVVAKTNKSSGGSTSGNTSSSNCAEMTYEQFKGHGGSSGGASINAGNGGKPLLMLNGKKPCNFDTYISKYKQEFGVVDAASPAGDTDKGPCEYKSLDDFKSLVIAPHARAKGAELIKIQQWMVDGKKVCNLDDLKKEYQDELDGLATILDPNNPDVCWRKDGTQACPKGYTGCGLQCAKNGWDCFKSIFKKVYKVASFVADIIATVASFGSYAALKAGIKTAGRAAITGIKNLATHAGKELAKTFVKKVATKYIKGVAEGIKDSKIEQMILDQNVNWSYEDFSALDPTGIADIVLAFWDAMCTNVNEKGKAIKEDTTRHKQRRKSKK